MSFFRLLNELNHRQTECENKLGQQEQTIGETKCELDSLAQQRVENRENLFLTKEEILDQDEILRRVQRKISRIQSSISDVSFYRKYKF